MFYSRLCIAVLTTVLTGSMSGTLFGYDNQKVILDEENSIEITPFVGPVVPFSRHKDHPDSRVTIFWNGVKFLEYDLLDVVDVRSEEIPAPHTHEYIGKKYPLSPNQRYIPVLANSRPPHPIRMFVVLFDLVEKRVFRQAVTEDSRPLRGNYAIRWLDNEKFLVFSLEPWCNAWVLHDIKDPSRNEKMVFQTDLVLDQARGNYCAIFGKPILFEEQRRSWEDKPTAARRFDFVGNHSESIRYNNTWVYPEFAQQFSKKTPANSDMVNAPDAPVGQQGINLERLGSIRRHMFSNPVFVGDTPWVAFLERVFEAGAYDRALESNLVLLDAHRVSTDPPRPEDIEIVKIPVPSLTPESVLEYIDMAKHLETRWDGTTNRLAVVQTKKGLPKEQETTLYEVPIEVAEDQAAVSPVRFGGEVTFHLATRDYVPLEKE